VETVAELGLLNMSKISKEQSPIRTNYLGPQYKNNNSDIFNIPELLHTSVLLKNRSKQIMVHLNVTTSKFIQIPTNHIILTKLAK